MSEAKFSFDREYQCFSPVAVSFGGIERSAYADADKPRAFGLVYLKATHLACVAAVETGVPLDVVLTDIRRTYGTLSEVFSALDAMRNPPGKGETSA